MHHSKVAQEMEVEGWAVQIQEVLLQGIEGVAVAEPTPAKGKRGRPETIQEAHLWMSLLWSVLLGMKSYADWWRLFYTQAVGPFAPKQVSVDALTTRLEKAGLLPLQQLASWVAERVAPAVKTEVAAFASEIVALDEST